MDSFTINQTDPLAQTINVTFNVNGVDYSKNISFDPHQSLDELNNKLARQLEDIQASVALSDTLNGSIFSVDKSGAVSNKIV